MNGRTQFANWALAALAIGGAVHVATIHAIPRFIMARALARFGEPNMVRVGSQPTAASRGVVRPSPDILYGACAFDLRSGPLHVTAPVPHTAYWSVSSFDSATNNFFVLDDQQISGGTADFFLVRPSQRVPDAGRGHLIVTAPTRRGLILFRAVIDNEAHLPQLTATLRQARCDGQ